MPTRPREHGTVRLRDVRRDDLPALFRHQADPVSSAMAAFTSRDRAAFDAHWTRLLSDTSVAKQTVLLEGEIVGSVVCFERDGLREIGYWIDRAQWGKGIASRALAEFLSGYEIRPLFAVVARSNAASLRVVQKCGFTIVADERGPTETRGPEVEEVVLRLG